MSNCDCSDCRDTRKQRTEARAAETVAEAAPDAVERAKRLRSEYYAKYDHCDPWDQASQMYKENWLRVDAVARDLYESPLRARIAELESQLVDARDVATANARLLQMERSGEKPMPLADVMRMRGMDATPEHVSPVVRVEEQTKRPKPQVGQKIERKFSNGKWHLKEVESRWRGVFWVKHEGEEVGTLDADEGRKWRWSATEEKPAPEELPPGHSAVTASSDGEGTLSIGAAGFTTIRPCRHCGVLIAGGPTACMCCAAKEEKPAPEAKAKKRGRKS